MAEVNTDVQTKVAKEHEESFDEGDFATMLEESLKEAEKDSNIEGIIVEIKDDTVLIDVGKKSEGRLNLSEILDSEGNPKYSIGDSITVVVTGFRNERPIVSHKKALKKEKIKAFIKEHSSEDDETIIEAKIISKNRGGFIAENSDGVEFFLPRSQAAIKDAQGLVGKSIKAKILKIDTEKESILISRKKL